MEPKDWSTYRDKFVANSGDDSSNRPNYDGTVRFDHEICSCSDSHSAGQSCILDMNLKKTIRTFEGNTNKKFNLIVIT